MPERKTELLAQIIFLGRMRPACLTDLNHAPTTEVI